MTGYTDVTRQTRLYYEDRGMKDGRTDVKR